MTTFKIPPELERRILAEGTASLERGRAVLQTAVLQAAVVLTVLLVALAAIFGFSNGFSTTVIVAVASVFVIRAIMSVSAALNCQFDLLMTIISYYAENESKNHKAL